MSITDYFRYYENNELQIVELPYKKDSMSAVILLPNEDKNINDFISELNDDKLQKLLKRMNPTKIELNYQYYHHLMMDYPYQSSSYQLMVLVKVVPIQR